MWHYFKKYYGSKIKYLVLHKSKKKIAYNSKFIFFLSLLELRLNVILLRMLFVFKLVEANFLIRYGFINVNKKKKQTNYIVNIKDVIQKNIILVNKKIRKKKWRIYQWRK